MPKVPITMPQLGESMAEATIVAIKVQPGDKVSADQEIIEVETDKAVMGVTTPCAGEIAKIDAQVEPLAASVSCAVTRSRPPEVRTLPSRTWPTERYRELVRTRERLGSRRASRHLRSPKCRRCGAPRGACHDS